MGARQSAGIQGIFKGCAGLILSYHCLRHCWRLRSQVMPRRGAQNQTGGITCAQEIDTRVDSIGITKKDRDCAGFFRYRLHAQENEGEECRLRRHKASTQQHQGKEYTANDNQKGPQNVVRVNKPGIRCAETNGSAFLLTFLHGPGRVADNRCLRGNISGDHGSHAYHGMMTNH